MAFSDGDSNQFELFVGPKDLDLLKQHRSEAQTVGRFRMASVLAKPLFLHRQLGQPVVVHNFGWSIVLVTIVINLALFPLQDFEHEVDAQDAGAQAADGRHQRQVQGLGMRDPKKRPADSRRSWTCTRSTASIPWAAASRC